MDGDVPEPQVHRALVRHAQEAESSVRPAGAQLWAQLGGSASSRLAGDVGSADGCGSGSGSGGGAVDAGAAGDALAGLGAGGLGAAGLGAGALVAGAVDAGALVAGALVAGALDAGALVAGARVAGAGGADDGDGSSGTGSGLGGKLQKGLGEKLGVGEGAAGTRESDEPPRIWSAVAASTTTATARAARPASAQRCRVIGLR